MPLPVSAVSKGSAAKFVCCEQCGQEYVYIVSRRAAGMGRSYVMLDVGAARARAKRNADDQLAWDLSEAIEPAPCPHCDRLQKDMVRIARKRRHRWMTYLGGTTLFCGLLYLPIYFLGQSGGQFATGKNWSLMPAWIAIAFGIAVMLLRFYLLKSYDAQSPAERAKWTRKLNGGLYTLDEWDQLNATHGSMTTHAHESERRDPAANAGEADALSGLADSMDSRGRN